MNNIHDKVQPKKKDKNKVHKKTILMTKFTYDYMLGSMKKTCTTFRGTYRWHDIDDKSRNIECGRKCMNFCITDLPHITT